MRTPRCRLGRARRGVCCAELERFHGDARQGAPTSRFDSARLTEQTAAPAEQAPVASAADEGYCSPALKRILRRVLMSCGLVGSGAARGCQPVQAKSVATMSDRDFNALFRPMKDRGGIVQFDKDKAELYHDFVDFLCEQYAQGKRTLLIVDEAQNLDAESLEEIRLLTNVNADEHLVMQLLLVGQPELHDLLKRHELRQLAQRIGVFARLGPLDEKETADYVRHRMQVVGGSPNLFHKNALRLIHWNSGGIPRVINTLCELALVYGYADGKRRIDATLIADIARDRIGTGLYGNQVFDISALRDNMPSLASEAPPTPRLVSSDSDDGDNLDSPTPIKRRGKNSA
mgnify:CR=1 FL=1